MVPNPLWAAMASGLVAGMFAAAITTPADVIKTNIQAARPPAPGALSEEASGARVESQPVDVHDELSNAHRASERGRETAATNPAAVSNVGKQKSRPDITHGKDNVWSMTQKIYAKKGWQGFWSGVDARISRQAPAQGVCLFVFECLKQTFRKKVLLGSLVEVAVSDDVIGVKYYARNMNIAVPPGQTSILATTAVPTALSAVPDALPGPGLEAASITQIAAPFQSSFVGAPGGGEVDALLLHSLGNRVAQNIDVELGSQTAATAAAALSQNLLESVVVPVWNCGGYYLGADALSSCVNQAIAQF